MAGKTTWIVFLIYSLPNLSHCTRSAGLLADKRMNMNILKMFDRFFYVRHKDEFFIRNFKKYVTDDYLTSFYGNEFKMTKTLKKDLSMHAIYLENTVWHTTSITELFSIVYTKYLAANHSMSFINCRVYYTYKDINEEKAAKCGIVANYLYSIVMIALEKYVNRTEEFLHLILDPRSVRQYRDFFKALSRYFTHVTFAMQRNYLKPEKISVSEGSTPIKDRDFLEKNMDEEKKALNKKELKSLQNETIKFWEVADKMARAIENRNPLTARENSRKTVSGNVIIEKIVKSNVARTIRKLEIRNLLTRGITLDPEGISKLKNGSEEEIFQLIVDPGYSFGQQLRFVPVAAEKLNNLPIDINEYAQMGIILDEEEFSSERKENNLSDEKYLSTSMNLKSSTNESYRTTHNSSKRSSSQQISTESQKLLNKLRVENIKRNMKARLSAEEAKKSSKMDDFRPPSDVSHLKGRMASSSRVKSQEIDVDRSITSPEENISNSNYYDASQDVSAMQSNSKQKHGHTRFYDENTSKQNLESSSRMISAY